MNAYTKACLERSKEQILDDKFHELGFKHINLAHLPSLENLWNSILTEEYITDDVGEKPIRYPVWELGVDPNAGKQEGRTFDDRWTEDCEIVPCPHWTIDNGKWITEDAIPEVYRDFVSDLVSIIGQDFNHIDCMLHNTLINYMNPWHNHFLDGSPYNVLVHMGVETRTDEDGGRLELGRLDNREEYGGYIKYIEKVKSEKRHQALPLYAEGFTVNKVGEVPCHHGDITIIKNSCAKFVHQVSMVKSDAPRYTLLLSMSNK
jgi:hypothetical protein